MSSELNKAGRRVWFRHVEGGAYRPVTGAGVLSFALAIGWVLACGVLGMAAFAVTLDGRWFGAMFAATAIGLACFATIVMRHS